MRRRLTVLFVLLALVLAACGGSGVEESGGGGDNGNDDVKGDVTTTTAEDDGDDNGNTDDTADDNGGDGGDIPAGQDPEQILGDDEELNDLAEACFDGDMFSCDILFNRTEVDSDLETYSQTCGGRIDEVDGAPGCAEEFDAEPPDPQQPGDLGSDSAFDDLADECFDGDFGACDELFLESDVDSAYEAYGSTCGGRLEVEVSGGCDTLFASVSGSSGSDDGASSDN